MSTKGVLIQWNNESNKNIMMPYFQFVFIIKEIPYQERQSLYWNVPQYWSLLLSTMLLQRCQVNDMHVVDIGKSNTGTWVAWLGQECAWRIIAWHGITNSYCAEVNLGNKNIFPFSIIFHNWQYASFFNHSSKKPSMLASCLFNTMAADVLTTQGARASAAMALI